jgi:hypothetical protein
LLPAWIRAMTPCSVETDMRKQNMVVRARREQSTKLELRRETLRQLQAGELAEVAGGSSSLCLSCCVTQKGAFN